MIRMSFEKREKRSKAVNAMIPVISILISLVLGSIVLLFCKANPITTYKALIDGIFGTPMRIQNTINRMIPILFCALSVGVAFRLKFWNIGAEGQYVWGVIGITWVMQFSKLPPGPLMTICGLIVATLLGGIWGGIPGFLKAKWEVNENLTTLMMNYIAIGIAEYLYISAWKAPKGNMGTVAYPAESVIGTFWGKAHNGLWIVLALCVILYFVLYRTRWGFELNMIGKNSFAARCQGVSIERNIVLAMILSGAIAGLGGGVHASAIMKKLSVGVDSGFGFTGIIVAWMSGLNPFLSIIYAFVLAGLEIGANRLQIAVKLPAALGEVLQGLILIPLLASNIFIDYKLVFKKRDRKEVKA